MSNSKRRNFDITKFFYNIHLYLYPIKIILHLLGKLYFCIVLCTPYSMNTQLLRPFQNRTKIPILKIKIVTIQNNLSSIPTCDGFGFHTHELFIQANTEMKREEKKMKAVPLLLFNGLSKSFRPQERTRHFINRDS